MLFLLAIFRIDYPEIHLISMLEDRRSNFHYLVGESVEFLLE